MKVAFRIAIVNSSSEIAGAEVSLLELLRGLASDIRDSVIVVLPDAPGALPHMVRELGFTVSQISMPPLSTGRVILPWFKTIKALWRLIGQHRIRVVYANQFRLSFAVAVVRLLRPVRTVVHVRDFVWHALLLRHLAWLHDDLVFNARWLRDAAVKNAGALLRRPRCHMVYNSVDLAQITPLEQRPSSGECGIVIGMFGRFVQQKNFHYVLEILNRDEALRSQIREVLLVGAGRLAEPAYQSQLQSLVGYAPRLAQKVRIVDFVDDPWPLYAECDVVVVPSIREPFGRVVIEAGALAKAVLVADEGGPGEIIQDGVTGLKWRLAEKDQFIAKLTALAQDGELRTRLGAQFQADVLERFGSQRYVREMWNIIVHGTNAPYVRK